MGTRLVLISEISEISEIPAAQSNAHQSARVLMEDPGPRMIGGEDPLHADFLQRARQLFREGH